MNDVKLGALCWNQYTAWPDPLEAGRRADRIGYDTLWTWGQVQSSGRGPIVSRSAVRDSRPLTAR